MNFPNTPPLYHLWIASPVLLSNGQASLTLAAGGPSVEACETAAANLKATHYLITLCVGLKSTIPQPPTATILDINTANR